MSKASLSRSSQAKMNVAVSVMYQAVVAIIGLIIPRITLQYFGSEANGMLQSISQILGYTTLLEGGIGGMVVAAFYKPLAEENTQKVSDIFNNTKKFFKGISLVYVLFVLFLIFAGGFIIRTEFDNVYLGFMVLILGASNYFSYYFAVPHRLLLRADQKLRVAELFQMVAMIVNAVATVMLIVAGADIHTVKLVSAVVFLITPVGIRLYVKKHYKLSKTIFDPELKLPQKRDGIAHHLSFFIHNNTDIVILTVFRGVKDVSVYSVYNSVVVGFANLMSAISSGLAATLGNIIALDEKENLKKSFEIYNTVNMALATFFCVCFAVLLIPFVKIYTAGITDAEYIRPIFAYLLVITEWIYFVRIPYTTAASSAGHYKETKVGAIVEAALNVGMSLILVNFFGIEGVMMGTLIAMTYRTGYMVFYLSKNIVYRSVGKFFVEMLLNLTVGALLILGFMRFMQVSTDNFVAFVIDAVIVAAVSFVVVMSVNMVTNKIIVTGLKNMALKKRN